MDDVTIDEVVARNGPAEIEGPAASGFLEYLVLGHFAINDTDKKGYDWTRWVTLREMLATELDEADITAALVEFEGGMASQRTAALQTILAES